LWALHACGALLGWLVYAASPTYRRRLAHNARLAGLGWRDRWRAAAHAGRMVAELPRLWLGAPVPVRMTGAQHIEAALAQGQGLLFLTPHLGCFEITAQAYAERFGRPVDGPGRGMTVLFRPARKPWLRQVIASARQRPGLATAPTSLAGVKQLLKALKNGEAVGLLPDQVPPEGMGVWAPFFGQPAYTMTLAARLAQQTGAPLGVVWGERLPRGAGYVVRALPLPVPLPEARPGEDEATRQHAAAAALNRAMEAVIRLKPEQYLWGYHRYKQPRQVVAGGGTP
jgi:KDO2-lipid IV(A) lauroyltransferase